MNQNKPIFIVSAPRSGSSLTGFILHTAGVFGGKMKSADKWNVRGYFENIAITHLLIAYMMENDKNQLLKRYNPLHLEADFPNFDKAVYHILTREGYDGHGLWFYKNPKIAYCWHLLNRYFPEAKWIIVRRNQKEILDSILRTDFMNAYESVIEWCDYLARYDYLMNKISDNCKHVHEVNINRIIDNDTDEIKNMLTFVGREYYADVMDCVLKQHWNGKK